MVKETSKIRIYSKSPFKNDYANVLNFETKEEMEKFFTEKNEFITQIYQYDNFQYIDRNGSIFVSGRVEKFEGATYMRFKNNGRTYYAFIFDVLYENEGTSQIIYEVDVWNTYLFELKNTRINGHVEQHTRKNTLVNIMDGQQGFQVGTRYAVKAGKVGIKFEWLVIVAKPTITLSTKVPRSNDMSFSGIQKSFKYFVIPVDIESEKSVPFVYKGKKTDGFVLENLYKHLFGIKNKESGTVNQIVNMYLTRDAGIKHEVKKADDGSFYIDITDKFFNARVQEVGEMNTRNFRPDEQAGGGGQIGDDGDISTEEKRVRLVTRLIKQLVPSATANGIAGIVGNFSAESSVTAKRYECDWLTSYQYDKVKNEPTAENLVGSWSAFTNFYSIPLYEAGYLVNGKHYIGVGLGQWTGPRSKALQDFSIEKNKSIWSFGTQMEFMNSESRKQQFQDVARSNDTPENNAKIFMQNWEGVNYKLAERQAAARAWLPTIQNELAK